LSVQLVFKISNLCDHKSPTSQTDRQTTCDRKTALSTKVHCAVKMSDMGVHSTEAWTQPASWKKTRDWRGNENQAYFYESKG